MSYILYILCRSDTPIICESIATFINEGVYFEEQPVCHFTPSEILGRVSIRYDSYLPPIVVERLADDDAQATIDEAYEAVARARTSDKARLQQLIKSTHQVIAIEIDRQSVTDEAWEMVDCLENHIINTCQGLLYAYDDGFYGEGLALIGALKK